MVMATFWLSPLAAVQAAAATAQQPATRSCMQHSTLQEMVIRIASSLKILWVVTLLNLQQRRPATA